MRQEAKASGRCNRASEESQTQESQEGLQTCDQTTSTPEKVDQQTQEKDDEPRRAAETAVAAPNAGAGHNCRDLMYKTGTARMLRQGMGGKICRAPKVGGV